MCRLVGLLISWNTLWRDPKKAERLSFFLQGWPDNRGVWDCLSADKTLSSQKRLYINFPNTSTTQQQTRTGLDFHSVVERLKVTLDSVGVQKYSKKMIVAHDWGCFYTYLFDKTYPNYIDQIVALEVPAFMELKGLFAITFVFMYQLTLIFAYLIGGRPGRVITQAVVKFFRYSPAHLDTITSSRNYPYFYSMRNVLSSLFDKRRKFFYKYQPSVPVVFLYAKDKPFQFFGDCWMKYLNESKDCQMHAVTGGHWIMIEHTRFLIDLILRRLQ